MNLKGKGYAARNKCTLVNHALDSINRFYNLRFHTLKMLYSAHATVFPGKYQIAKRLTSLVELIFTAMFYQQKSPLNNERAFC